MAGRPVYMGRTYVSPRLTHDEAADTYIGLTPLKRLNCLRYSSSTGILEYTSNMLPT